MDHRENSKNLAQGREKTQQQYIRYNSCLFRISDNRGRLSSMTFLYIILAAKTRGTGKAFPLELFRRGRAGR